MILGSAETTRQLIQAIGVAPMCALKAVVPIGPTTAAALASAGIPAEPPGEATFAAAIEQLVAARNVLA